MLRLDKLLEEALGGRVSDTIKNRLKDVLDAEAGQQAAKSYGRALTKAVDEFAGRAFEELSAAAVLQVANGLVNDAATALEAVAADLRAYPQYAVEVEASRADRTTLKAAQNARLSAQDQIRADLGRVLRVLADAE